MKTTTSATYQEGIGHKDGPTDLPDAAGSGTRGHRRHGAVDGQGEEREADAKKQHQVTDDPDVTHL